MYDIAFGWVSGFPIFLHHRFQFLESGTTRSNHSVQFASMRDDQSNNAKEHDHIRAHLGQQRSTAILAWMKGILNAGLKRRGARVGVRWKGRPKTAPKAAVFYHQIDLFG